MCRQTLTIFATLWLAICASVAICDQQPAELKPESTNRISPTVSTKSGPIQGVRRTVLNRTLDLFWGIPYAKPPVGDLRFRHPIPADPWTEVRNCTEPPNACPQPLRASYRCWTFENKNLSEDCLYLNVIAPSKGPEEQPRGPLQVVVYIHGGMFIRGYSADELINGSVFAAFNDVIFVSFNYRLGSYGFLYSGTEDAPGNAALMDQLLALRWIQENIQQFRGDPRSITLIGRNAGAASVGFLMFSPLASGHFQRVVLLSGSPTDPRLRYELFRERALNRTRTLAEVAGCDSRSSAVRCLRSIPQANLTEIQEKFRDYRPVFTGPFFPDSPDDVYKMAAAKNVSVLQGANENEGTLYLLRRHRKFLNDGFNGLLSLRQLLQIINSELESYPDGLDPQQKLVVFHSYVNWETPGNGTTNFKLAGDLLTDIMCKCPMNEFAREMTDRGLDLFYYVLAHRPSLSKWPEWTAVTHGSELPFIFGHPLRDDGYTEQEIKLSEKIMTYFGTFARTGNPSQIHFNWPKYRKPLMDYVELTTDGPAFKNGPRAKECALWSLILPKMAEFGCSKIPAH